MDNRPLAVLAGIDADRVAAAGWAFGAFTAGLTGCCSPRTYGSTRTGCRCSWWR
ncbi:hypothetical protein O1L60_08210 [Streptomyces diastatochromogenes]|nr:hypothetical protein [Streptomyces diastatochromogenes]